MTTMADKVLERVAEEEEPLEEVGELETSEYIVLLLALDTYNRYIEEVEGEDTADDLVRKGIMLVRRADRRYQDSIQEFLKENVPSDSQKKMITRAFKAFKPTAHGLTKRTYWLRTSMSRGGATTMRAVFKTNLALRKVRIAMEASMMEDADAALDKLAAIPMRNQLIRKWIDDAADNAGSGTYQNAVSVSADEGSDDVASILSSRTKEQGASVASEDSQEASGEKEDRLTAVQEKATAAAAKAMEVSGEEDLPPVKSEVVGIATAAAIAAVTDPDNPQNVPAPLRRLDPEQRAAALTDGRVLIAAGAGSGKSTTMVARIEYLIKDRRVNPSRILATSFNTKAANELAQKIGVSVGGDDLKQMSVGTMHSLFKRFIGEYGTAQERTSMGLNKNYRKAFIKQGGPVARAVQNMWVDCYGEESSPPKMKNVTRMMALWSGNMVSPADAKQQAQTEEERDAANWYEMYEGLKGAIPGWQPPCKGKPYNSFMSRWRPNGERLGDFSDMIKIFLDILEREPQVRKKIQSSLDHIIVDECQDLNQVQNRILELMSEHITDGSDGKSICMVGDDSQSIYGFRAARPDIFIDRANNDAWKLQKMRTNYRCPPEVVDAANRLIKFNENRIDMEANPAPGRARGMASLKVETSEDEATAALNVVEEIKVTVESGGSVSDNAILTRTNKEQHSYETACIIRGIPYARKGASSFLGSPETKAFLSYVQLATGSDFKKMQKALEEVINRPNRFFVSPDQGAEAVETAFSDYARRSGKNLKDIHPMAAMDDNLFLEILASKLTRSRSGFKFTKGLEKLGRLKDDIDQMRVNSEDDAYTTKDMFDDILNMTGVEGVTNPRTGKVDYVEQTFRDSLKAFTRDSVSEEEDLVDEDEEDETAGLGNISFLYELMKPDPTDPDDSLNDPGTPFGFKSKMERYAKKARELRVDITKWDKAQEALPPEDRKPPPGVYIGTVHSTKGAQWANCYVQMPKGKFPFEPPVRPGEEPKPEAVLQEEMESERRLGYVAITRAAKNLTIVCPSEVGGKAAGVSPFVDEAGLTVGENVTKPGAETVDDEPAVKTASIGDGYDGLVPDAWEDSKDWSA